jgi:hypothetical protein
MDRVVERKPKVVIIRPGSKKWVKPTRRKVAV